MTPIDPAALDPSVWTATCLAQVERAVAEMRRGGVVALLEGDKAALVLAAETVEQPALATLLAASPAGQQGGKKAEVRLVLTAERAQALQKRGLAPLPASGPDQDYRLLAVAGSLAAEAVRQLADPTAPVFDALGLNGALGITAAADISPALCQGSIELAKAARLLPAAILVLVPRAGLDHWVDPAFRLEARDLAHWRRNAAANLRRVSSARVPLEGAEDAEIIAFRPHDGGKEHLAIVIGKLDTSKPVLTRLHSECFTGDLLGSLRCDCGEQLRGAISAIAQSGPNGAGSGILLYLAQEGRGIGLVNKLRAYRLQDAGADTLDANLQLGFGADERLYQPAAEMLRQLGVGAVRLLTNNPDKVTGLAQCGITVTERVPHVFPSNDHNERYLSTKAMRFGHMF